MMEPQPDRAVSSSRQIGQRIFSGLSILICLLAINVIIREFSGINWRDVLNNINHISLLEMGIALLFVLCSYGAIACYDILAFKYIQKQLAIHKIAFAGLITYSISPNVGFAFLSGSVLRYRLYRQWNISHFDIAKIIAFTNFNLWVGLIPITGFVFSFNYFPIPEEIDLPFVEKSVRDLGLFLLSISGIYLLGSIFIRKPLQWKTYQLQFPSIQVSLQQVIIFALDWGFAALALFYLLKLPISYPFLFGVYVIAMISGLVSTIPGGLGIFETVILLFFTHLQDPEILLATLIVFRGLYYLLPFAIAVFALAIFEFWQNARLRKS